MEESGGGARRWCRVEVLVLLWGGLLLLCPRPSEGYLRGDPLVYAAIMKEASISGSWLSLEFAGQPYFHKPPLLFALGAAMFKAFGACNFTARLLGVIPALALLLAVFALGRRLMDVPRAFLAALITLTSYVFLRNAGVPRMDVPVTLVLVLSVLVLLEGERRPRLLPLFWVLAGIGVLLKGPSGLLPLGVAGAWALLRRRPHPWDSGWFWAGAPALPLLVAPWILANLDDHGGAFLQGYFRDDLAKIAFAGEAQASPFEKYGHDLVFEWWPWIPFMLHGAWIAARESFRGRREEPWPLLVAWLGVVVVALLSLRGAYSRYTIPLLPAASLAAAHSLTVLLPRIRFAAAPRVVVALAAAGSFFVAFWPYPLRARDVPDVVRYAPVLQAHGSFDPPLQASRRGHVSREDQAAAIFYLDRTIRSVDDDDILSLLADGRDRVVLAPRARNRWPEGVVGRRLAKGGALDLFEVGLASSHPEGPR